MPGCVFAADTLNSRVEKLNYADPPSLSFATTSVGSESSDSPRSVTVLNNGNAALTFPIPGSGDNPSIADGFSLGSATTCPQLTPSSSPAGTLGADASCTYAVDFIPAAAGTNSGSAVLTDDNLNVAGAQQSIGLIGTGVLIAVSPATLPAGTVATAYSSQMLSASGGTAPYSFAVTSGALPGGLSLSTAGAITGTPTAAGTFNFTVTATDSSIGASRYTGSAAYLIVVNKATPAVSAWPAASAITYGQTLASSTLSGGTASTTGTFAFTTPTTAPGAGTASESVTFTPSDTADYNTASGSVSVTVNKAAATVTLGNLAQTYTGSPLSATATTSPAGLTVNFTYNGSASPPAAVGSYTVAGTIANANYAGSAAGTLVIHQATLTVTANNATRVYGTANPAFMGSVTGQQSGDTFTESFSTGATISSPTRAYAIVPSAVGANLSDYTQTITNGTLTVTQAGSSTSLGVSSASITPGQSVTLSAQAATVLSGCAGGFFTQQPRNYAITLTATAANLQHTATFTLDVQALGRSRGGLSTKIHLLADEDGLPLEFRITAGQAGEYAPAAQLLEGQHAQAVIADRGYDADALLEQSENIGATAVIRQNAIANSSGPMTMNCTSSAIALNAASTSSNTSAASPHATVKPSKPSAPSPLSPVLGSDSSYMWRRPRFRRRLHPGASALGDQTLDAP